MLEFLTRYASMRIVLALIACVISGGAGPANADEPAVTVAPLLLMEPSTEETTTELSSIGVHLTEPGELVPGDTLYLEIWFQTTGPNGITSARFNISYETDLLDTSLEQITLASGWMDLWAPVRVVDDAAGLITDVGAVRSDGSGLAPHWAKLTTIEFDVIETPDDVISACTVDGGPERGFGMEGMGEVEDVDYGCTCVEESSLDTLGTFVTCLSGPDDTAAQECMCADLDRNRHVDLADFAALQVAFRGG